MTMISLTSSFFTYFFLLFWSQELYVQRNPNSSVEKASTPPTSSTSCDISYPWLCNNGEIFPAHQTEINSAMHITLVDWLVEVCNECGLQSNTLCLTVHLMDEVLRRERDVPTERFQLLGCASLMLAAKLEQVQVSSHMQSFFLSIQHIHHTKTYGYPTPPLRQQSIINFLYLCTLVHFSSVSCHR